MVSAAISMMAGVEQTKVRPVSDDLFSSQGELGDFSFAKSFNERVGVATSSQEKNTADDLGIAFPSLKGSTLTKQLEEVAGRSSGVKEESISAKEISVCSELKGAAAGKIVQPQATTVAGSQEKTTADDAGTRKVEVPAQVEGTADDVSPIPYATPAPGATDESAGPHVSIADGDRPLVPVGIEWRQSCGSERARSCREGDGGRLLEEDCKSAREFGDPGDCTTENRWENRGCDCG